MRRSRQRSGRRVRRQMWRHRKSRSWRPWRPCERVCSRIVDLFDDGRGRQERVRQWGALALLWRPRDDRIRSDLGPLTRSYRRKVALTIGTSTQGFQHRRIPAASGQLASSDVGPHGAGGARVPDQLNAQRWTCDKEHGPLHGRHEYRNGVVVFGAEIAMRQGSQSQSMRPPPAQPPGHASTIMLRSPIMGQERDSIGLGCYPERLGAGRRSARTCEEECVPDHHRPPVRASPAAGDARLAAPRRRQCAAPEAHDHPRGVAVRRADLRGERPCAAPPPLGRWGARGVVICMLRA